MKDYKNKPESNSQYLKRAIFFSHKLSRSKGEITDKGSINQMAFILNRNSLVKKLYANKIVLGCDTVIYHNGKILDKVNSIEKAQKKIKSLSGKTHLIVSVSYTHLTLPTNREV